MLTVGVALKPHGLKGELKILPLLDSPKMLADIKKACLNGVVFEIESLRITSDFAYVLFKGISDRNSAETFRGSMMCVDHENRPAIPKDRYYISDLLGAKIVSENKDYGALDDVLNYGASDVYCVNGEKRFMFPAIDKVILDIDLKNMTIKIDALELDKVIVYED
jgi:16S rRNA processing protein RimM